jgi:hypothetical protein
MCAVASLLRSVSESGSYVKVRPTGQPRPARDRAGPRLCGLRSLIEHSRQDLPEDLCAGLPDRHVVIVVGTPAVQSQRRGESCRHECGIIVDANGRRHSWHDHARPQSAGYDGSVDEWPTSRERGDRGRDQ